MSTAKRRADNRKSVAISVRRAEKIVKTELEAQVKTAALEIVRKPGRPKGSTPFQRVQRAREILANAAPLAAKLLQKGAKIAAEKGDTRPAEFLLKHVAVEDESGKLIRPLQSSVDKIEGQTGPTMPTIAIGWITPPALPSAQPAIDVEAKEVEPETV